MYHWQSLTMEDIIFATTKTVSNKKFPIRYSIKELVEQHKQTEHLLFAHAWTGCDTTSAIHKYGKAKIFQLLKTKSDQVAISCFGDMSATQDSVGNAGIKMFVRWLVVIISLFLLSCEVEGGGREIEMEYGFFRLQSNNQGINAWLLIEGVQRGD